MNKEEADLIITEQNKSTEEILKAVAKIKSDYHELCNLKDKRIAYLEAENEQIKNSDTLCKLIGEQKRKIAELEKENADLKCECRTCVYTDSPCVRSDYPSKDGVCSHYKNVFDENVELTEQNKHLYNDLTMTEAENAELKEENKVMADNYSKMEQKFYDNLTKAKELLAKWVELFKPKGGNIPPTPIQVDTEQFLNSEVEK